MKKSLAKRIFDLFFEEVPDYYVNSKRSIGILKEKKKIEKEQKQKIKGAKTLVEIIPLIAIILIYLLIYFVFQERFQGISFFSWVFGNSTKFFLVMELYFCYLTIVELIYMIYYNTKFKTAVYDKRINDSINIMFVIILMEIICTLVHYILGYSEMYLMLIPLVISVIVVYLYFRFIVNSLSKAYRELIMDFEENE